MPQFRSIAEYSQTLNKRVKELKKLKTRTPLTASKFFIKTAKALAPLGDGEIKAGFKSKRIKNGIQITNKVSGTFKHNLFANRTGKYAKLHYGSKGGWIPPSRSKSGKWVRVAKPNSIAVYGKFPNWKWTGTPMFFDVAIKLTRKPFREYTFKNVHKIMNKK